MIKSFKIFEELNNFERKKLFKEIQIEFVKEFHSEEEYDDFCMGVDGVDDLDDVYWDGIPGDTIDKLSLYNFNGISHDELLGVMSDVISETNLDEFFEKRGISYEEWEAKKMAGKYNL